VNNLQGVKLCVGGGDCPQHRRKEPTKKKETRALFGCTSTFKLKDRREINNTRKTLKEEEKQGSATRLSKNQIHRRKKAAESNKEEEEYLDVGYPEGRRERDEKGRRDEPTYP